MGLGIICLKNERISWQIAQLPQVFLTRTNQQTIRENVSFFIHIAVNAVVNCQWLIVGSLPLTINN